MKMETRERRWDERMREEIRDAVKVLSGIVGEIEEWGRGLKTEAKRKERAKDADNSERFGSYSVFGKISVCDGKTDRKFSGCERICCLAEM